jgi:hypothetical protein
MVLTAAYIIGTSAQYIPRAQRLAKLNEYALDYQHDDDERDLRDDDRRGTDHRLQESVTIAFPPPAFDNAGGGCGKSDCDYQVQCDECFTASRAQLAAFWAEHGCRHPIMIGLYDESAMRDAAHVEALRLNVTMS